MKQVTLQKNAVKALLTSFLLAILIAGPRLAGAQEMSAAADSNMAILMEKLKADKKLLVASNMSLTDAEAQAFWPLYEEYQKELQALNERLKKAIEGYAEAYNANTLTDESALKLLDEATAIDEAEVQMRKSYAAKLNKVLPGKKVARYLQIENKVRALIRYGLAAEIPLVE